jgi:hypothetical protein
MKGRRVGNKEGREEGWKEWVRMGRMELQNKGSREGWEEGKDGR